MLPPHKDFQEKIALQSNKKHSDWQAKWEIIAIYPKCIRKEHLRHHTLERLEEWLLLDVVQTIEKAEQIQQLITTPEIRDAFAQLDLSGLTDEEIQELEFQQAVTDRYQQPFKKHLKQRDLEIAKNLLTLGIEIEAIIQATNLTDRDIRALQESFSA